MHALRDSRGTEEARPERVVLFANRLAAPLAEAARSLRALEESGGDPGAAERRSLVQRSLRAVRSAQAVLERVLELAAIRAGRSCANVQPVDVAAILRRELAERRARLRALREPQDTDTELVEGVRENGPELVFRDHGRDSRVLADPDGVRIIFSNLLDNSLGYTTGPAGKIEVDVTGDGGCVRVRVRDNGRGIPPEDQHRVFEEFHCAENVGADGASGAGLGLAFVRELVRRYGGGLDIESAVGVGTSIFIRLPGAASALVKEKPAGHEVPRLRERPFRRER